jgi:hypothetical protein
MADKWIRLVANPMVTAIDIENAIGRFMDKSGVTSLDTFLKVFVDTGCTWKTAPKDIDRQREIDTFIYLHFCGPLIAQYSVVSRNSITQIT